MVEDYQDFTQDVTRTPIQAVPAYQSFGVINTDEIAAAASDDYFIWDIPNNGLYYAIDTIFIYWLDLYPMLCWVERSLLRVPYTWNPVGVATREYSVEIVPSKLGALSLTYPNSLRLGFHNSHNHTLEWYGVINYFTYVV